jgi:hypothetical protein
MSDLSQRFAELMARMARSDADLFRTVGEQNAAVRRMVEEVLPEESCATNQAPAEGGKPVALAPMSLLPREECSLPRLKARFRTLAPARAFMEERLGPLPAGVGKFSWALVQRTVEAGQWPEGRPPGSAGKASSGGALAAMEQRIELHLERVEQRLERMEPVLLQLLDRQV